MQILHKYEYGKTLDYVDAKLEVKHDNSGNVQFTRTEAGLKADVPTDGTTITIDQHGVLTANTSSYVDVFGDPYITAF